MPYYNFKNNDTGEEWEEFFTISGREEFLKSNPHITQMPSLFSMQAVLVTVSKMMRVGKKTYQELQRHIHVLILQTDIVRSL